MNLEIAKTKIFAATGGRPFDAAQPIVLFIHGAGMDHTVWGLQARYFAHHGRTVLALDLPGHGRSAGVPLDSIEKTAAWITRLLDAVEVKSAALVGHRRGGLLALGPAARGRGAGAAGRGRAHAGASRAAGGCRCQRVSGAGAGRLLGPWPCRPCR